MISGVGGSGYQESIDAEKRIYSNCADVHRLPPIFHYWTQRHLLPKFQSLGVTGPLDLFLQELEACCRRNSHCPRFLSLGSGNCDAEIAFAVSLRAKGYDFLFECVDLNPAMLDRGRLAARDADLTGLFEFTAADFNHWHANHQYDSVIANQSLHHVVNLEGLFEQIKQFLRPGGKFLISDMIGRNGHQRWPESLSIIHEFWRRLPPSYRFNQMLGFYEEMYRSWDCSVQGFEGVRSQDILPLLLEAFHFELFLPYGNVIDPFVDRAFGHHFDPSREWDCRFIDSVHLRDDAAISNGTIKPTHMVAVVSNEPCSGPRFISHLTPRFCVRDPAKILPDAVLPSAYDWESWPHADRAELEIACGRLSAFGAELAGRTEWAFALDRRLEERTDWAISLERDTQALRGAALHIEQQLAQRTAWAITLDAHIEEVEARASQLQQQISTLEQQVEERTSWAQRLDRALAEEQARAAQLQGEIEKLVHHPFYLAKRLVNGVRRRLFR